MNTELFISLWTIGSILAFGLVLYTAPSVWRWLRRVSTTRRLVEGDTVLVKIGGDHYEVRVEGVTASRRHFRGAIPDRYSRSVNPAWHDVEIIEDRVARPPAPSPTVAAAQ